MFSKLLAVGAYTLILLCIAFVSVRKQRSAADFMVGGRSLNFWLTALAAHASDMSSWFLMGLPGILFAEGFINIWITISLLLFMFLNWHFVAPKVRAMTEKSRTLTFSSFFESRYGDSTGVTRLLSAAMLLLFFTIYVSAGLIGLGMLINTFFGVSYHGAIGISLAIVIPYLLLGGYNTLAKTDLFQGLFLLAVVLFVPFYVVASHFGSFDMLSVAAKGKESLLSALPKGKTGWLTVFYLMGGWGLGYFGQPHIVTKFMGIRDVGDMRKAKIVGMSWQLLALAAIVLISYVGMGFFPNGLGDNELVFIDMVNAVFHPFFAGFILCAVFAATISTINSQILVLASTLAQDCYKRSFCKSASEKRVVTVSRLCVIAIALLAFGIAWIKPSSIFSLVAYSWGGLGATFGPLLLFALYRKNLSPMASWLGLAVGGGMATFWPLIDTYLGTGAPAILPSFVLSCASIWMATRDKRAYAKTAPATHQ